MRALLEQLPLTVMIGGSEFDVNADFRASIDFETMMIHGEDDENVKDAIILYYGEQWRKFGSEDAEEAIDKLLWFYRCGKEEDSGSRKGSKTQIAYSFEHDWSYIYAAFMEQYGIDLYNIDFLHWWKFKAMFDSLSDDTKIMDIIKIRVMDIGKNMSNEQKNYYRKMKKLYALPGQKKSKRDEALERLLIQGGNPEEIFESI